MTAEPSPFRGPHRHEYTPEQFAEAYTVPVARVELWMRDGFLRHRYSRIAERDRLEMEYHYGAPSNSKTSLPQLPSTETEN